MVKDLAFTVYSVSDMPRAIAFYRDVIGLKPGDMFGERYAEFEVGRNIFAVGNGESIGIKPGSQFSVAFEVDDLDGMRQRLLDKGVDVTEIYDSETCKSAFVTDPDGNKFGIHRLK